MTSASGATGASSIGCGLLGGHYEVVQSVQDPKQSVPLIRGKRTVVRVFPVPTYATMNPAGVAVTGTLRVVETASGKETLLPPLNTVPSERLLDDLTTRRSTLDASLNFELPSTLLAGSLTVALVAARWVEKDAGPTVTTSPDRLGGTRDLAISFSADAVVLRLRLVGLRYRAADGTLREPREIDYQLIESWLRRAYPVSDVEVSRVVTDSGHSLQAGPADKINRAVCQVAAMRALDMSTGWSAELRRRQESEPIPPAGTVSGIDRRTHYYGLILDQRTWTVADAKKGPEDATFLRGRMAGLPRYASVASVGAGPVGTPVGELNDELYSDPSYDLAFDKDASFGDWYAGHEIGHLLGRRHVDALMGETDPDTDYPYLGGYIGDDAHPYMGFDVGDASLGIPASVLPYRSTHDVMSYGYSPWVSDYTYTGILERLREENRLAADGTRPGESTESTDSPVPGLYDDRTSWIHLVAARRDPTLVRHYGNDYEIAYVNTVATVHSALEARLASTSPLGDVEWPEPKGWKLWVWSGLGPDDPNAGPQHPGERPKDPHYLGAPVGFDVVEQDGVIEAAIPNDRTAVPLVRRADGSQVAGKITMLELHLDGVHKAAFPVSQFVALAGPFTTRLLPTTPAPLYDWQRLQDKGRSAAQWNELLSAAKARAPEVAAAWEQRQAQKRAGRRALDLIATSVGTTFGQASPQWELLREGGRVNRRRKVARQGVLEGFAADSPERRLLESEDDTAALVWDNLKKAVGTRYGADSPEARRLVFEERRGGPLYEAVQAVTFAKYDDDSVQWAQLTDAQRSSGWSVPIGRMRDAMRSTVDYAYGTTEDARTWRQRRDAARTDGTLASSWRNAVHAKLGGNSPEAALLDAEQELTARLWSELEGPVRNQFGDQGDSWRRLQVEKSALPLTGLLWEVKEGVTQRAAYRTESGEYARLQMERDMAGRSVPVDAPLPTAELQWQRQSDWVLNVFAVRRAEDGTPTGPVRCLAAGLTDTRLIVTGERAAGRWGHFPDLYRFESTNGVESFYTWWTDVDGKPPS